MLRTWRNALRSGALILALAFVGVGTGASPAQASSPGIEYSTDGVNYSRGDTLPLFDDLGAVVPGDSSTESIWVRNGSQVEAFVRIDALSTAQQNSELAKFVILGITSDQALPAAAFSLSEIAGSGGCLVLTDGIRLAPGASAKLAARVDVSNSLSGQGGVNDTVSFTLRGHMRDVVAKQVSDPGDQCSANDGSIPPTKKPTATPTAAPTATPTKSPSNSPTKAPTQSPTNTPTKPPTVSPTADDDFVEDGENRAAANAAGSARANQNGEGTTAGGQTGFGLTRTGQSFELFWVIIVVSMSTGFALCVVALRRQRATTDNTRTGGNR